MPMVLINFNPKLRQTDFLGNGEVCLSQIRSLVDLHLQVEDHPTLEVNVVPIQQWLDSRLPVFHFPAQLLRQVDAGITFKRLDVF